MAKRKPSSFFSRNESEEDKTEEVKKLKSSIYFSNEMNFKVSDPYGSNAKTESDSPTNLYCLPKTESSCSDVLIEDEADVIVELVNPDSPEDEVIITAPADKALSLQRIVEKLIDNTSCSDGQIVNKLKKGLCYSWIKHNFNCCVFGKNCTFQHNAREMFKKKLKGQPSNFIVRAIVEMRKDTLFPDALMEGFNILKARPNSQRFLPLICFFAFYVSDLSNSRYFEFWANAAQYFCTLIPSENQADGFDYLFKIFRLIDYRKQSKIIDFIKMLKNPYFNLDITWELLRSVIILKLPCSFLIEAVESCNKTKVNVDKVYQEIAARILVNTLSIDGIESMLLFCKTLENTDRFENAKTLKGRISTKVRALTTPIDENLYPETYLYRCELESKDLMPHELKNEDLDAEQVLKSDEEKVQRRAFSPPPQCCDLNFSSFMKHGSLPSKFEKRPRPPDTTLKRSRNKLSERGFCVSYEKLIKQVATEIKNYEFTRVGESLNRFECWRLGDAAKHIVQKILQMRISSDELLDFINKVTLACNSKNSAVIIASIAVTMMYFFVNCKQVDDWKTAYSILNLCTDKEIDLSLGKVFASEETEALSKTRIVLLLVEICLNNNKYEDAFSLIKKFDLFSACSLAEQNCLEEDSIRLTILKDFLKGLVTNQCSLFCETFKKAWEAQGDLQKDIDLTKYANEYLIVAINDRNVEALNDYRRLVPYNCLKEATSRAIVVALVRLGRIIEAESCVESLFQQIYKLPLVDTETIVLILQSCWTEEELFVVVEVLLNKLEKCYTSKDTSIFHLEIVFQVVQEKDLFKEVKVYPKAFAEIDCSFESAKIRMLNVFKKSTFQFLTFEDFGDRLIINPQSLIQQVQYRSQNRFAAIS